MASDDRKVFSQKDYEEAAQRLLDECVWLKKGQTREQCCKEKGIVNCPPEDKIEKENDFLILIPIFILLLFVYLVYLIIKKRWLVKIWLWFSEASKAVISGTAIWWIIVFSYLLVMEPYGSTMYSDEYFNLALWLILPPLCVSLIVLWVKRFFWKKK